MELRWSFDNFERSRYLPVPPRVLRTFRMLAFTVFMGWFLLFIGYSAVASSEESSPLIKFDATIFNAGKVKEGQIIKHTFQFENQGKGVLKILNIASG